MSNSRSPAFRSDQHVEGLSCRLFEAAGVDPPDLEGYGNSSAFTQAASAGCSSIENALLGSSTMLCETPRYLVKHGIGPHRPCLETDGENARLAIFDAGALLRVRHRLRHGEYDEFLLTSPNRPSRRCAGSSLASRMSQRSSRSRSGRVLPSRSRAFRALFPQTGAAVVAILTGGYLWHTLHGAGFSLFEQVKLSGVAPALICLSPSPAKS